MSDAFLKLRILGEFLSMALTNWKHDVWNRDLDSRFCCSGRECGCGGMTLREFYKNRRPDNGEATR